MIAARIPVVVGGQIVGHVSQGTTSIGAAKVAGCPVQFARVDGRYVWRALRDVVPAQTDALPAHSKIGSAWFK